MPRRPACGSDDIIKVISAAKEQIITRQNIAVPSEKVWVDLSQQLNNKVLPKNLYTFVKTNRHNIRQILKLCKNDTNIQYKDPNSDGLQESSVDFHSPVSKSDTKQISMLWHSEIRYEISLSIIWPEKVNYNDKYDKSLNTCKREYTILKRGAWTHFLYEMIWENIKTSCTLRFRRAKTFPNVASHFMEISGHCTKCDTQLSITAEIMAAANEPVVLTCMIHNVDESPYWQSKTQVIRGSWNMCI